MRARLLGCTHCCPNECRVYRCVDKSMDHPRHNEGPQPNFERTTSRHLPAWLATLHSSLVFTTDPTAKVFFIGLQPNGRMSIFEKIPKPVMGLWASASTLHRSTLYQLGRPENMLATGSTFNGYDSVDTPQLPGSRREPPTKTPGTATMQSQQPKYEHTNTTTVPDNALYRSECCIEKSIGGISSCGAASYE